MRVKEVWILDQLSLTFVSFGLRLWLVVHSREGFLGFIDEKKKKKKNRKLSSFLSILLRKPQCQVVILVAKELIISLVFVT